MSNFSVADAARERYLHDPTFHALVAHLAALLDATPNTHELDLYAALHLAIAKQRRHEGHDRMCMSMETLRAPVAP